MSNNVAVPDNPTSANHHTSNRHNALSPDEMHRSEFIALNFPDGIDTYKPSKKSKHKHRTVIQEMMRLLRDHQNPVMLQKMTRKEKGEAYTLERAGYFVEMRTIQSKPGRQTKEPTLMKMLCDVKHQCLSTHDLFDAIRQAHHHDVRHQAITNTWAVIKRHNLHGVTRNDVTNFIDTCPDCWQKKKKNTNNNNKKRKAVSPAWEDEEDLKNDKKKHAITRRSDEGTEAVVGVEQYVSDERGGDDDEVEDGVASREESSNGNPTDTSMKRHENGHHPATIHNNNQQQQHQQQQQQQQQHIMTIQQLQAENARLVQELKHSKSQNQKLKRALRTFINDSNNDEDE